MKQGQSDNEFIQFAIELLNRMEDQNDEYDQFNEIPQNPILFLYDTENQEIQFEDDDSYIEQFYQIYQQNLKMDQIEEENSKTIMQIQNSNQIEIEQTTNYEEEDQSITISFWINMKDISIRKFDKCQCKKCNCNKRQCVCYLNNKQCSLFCKRQKCNNSKVNITKVKFQSTKHIKSTKKSTIKS